jgi:hypothetical protein
MTRTEWTEEDSARAKQIWAEYQKAHDVSHLHGKAVGIDPARGRVWFGDTATDIFTQKEAATDESLLYLLRVGYDYYCRK